MPNQAEKAATFHALHHRQEPLIVANPWDAGTARILTALGFEALSTTSGGLAVTLGRRDGTASISRDEALANAIRQLIMGALDGQPPKRSSPAGAQAGS